MFDGKDITALPAHKRVAAGMARTFQITEIFPELSVRENLRIPVEVAAGLRLRPWLSRARRRADPSAARRTAGHGRAGREGRSSGRRALARRPAGHRDHDVAGASKPRLLLLDEPTAGMGDQETYDVTRLIRRLHRDQKLTIVLIEHDMRVVFHLADRIMVLAEGAVLAEGSADEIAKRRARPGRLPREDANERRSRREGLQTFYGKSHVLHGVGLDRRRRRDRRPCSAATAPASRRRCAA